MSKDGDSPEVVAGKPVKVAEDASLTNLGGMGDRSNPAVIVPTKEEVEAIRSLKDEDLSWLVDTESATQGNMLIKNMKANPFVPLGEISSVHKHIHLMSCV